MLKKKWLVKFSLRAVMQFFDLKSLETVSSKQISAIENSKLQCFLNWVIIIAIKWQKMWYAYTLRKKYDILFLVLNSRFVFVQADCQNKRNRPGGTVTFLQLILVSMILVYIIGQAVQITSQQVHQRGQRSYHSNIAHHDCNVK